MEARRNLVQGLGLGGLGFGVWGLGGLGVRFGGLGFSVWRKWRLEGWEIWSRV
jgi:hypothetical protein